MAHPHSCLLALSHSGSLCKSKWETHSGSPSGAIEGSQWSGGCSGSATDTLFALTTTAEGTKLARGRENNGAPSMARHGTTRESRDGFKGFL